MQVSLLGENGLSVVRNVGKARITGLEADLLLRPMQGLTWSTGVSYNHAVLREDFCFDENAADCRNAGLFGGLDLLAEKGDKLPLTAPWKGSSSLRYEWNLNSNLKANVQGVLTYEGTRRRDLPPGINEIFGNMKSYAETDVSADEVARANYTDKASLRRWVEPEEVAAAALFLASAASAAITGERLRVDAGRT